MRVSFLVYLIHPIGINRTSPLRWGKGGATIALNKEMLESYLHRWEAVVAIEEAEQRQASITDRWQKTNALLRMAITLGLPLNIGRGKDDDLINQRWNRLRSLHLGKIQPHVYIEYAKNAQQPLSDDTKWLD